MARMVVTMMVCGALGACSMGGGIPSLPTLGGAAEPEKTQKPAATSTQAPAEESSGLGGVWTNFSSAFSSGAQPVSRKADASAVDETEALRLVNDYRAKKGLRPLSMDPQASMAAAALAKDMAAHDRMSHYGPNGADVGKRLAAAGYTYKVAAENVGVGQGSLAEIIEGWKKSAPHSRNLLLPEATNMGIAFESNPNSKYKNFWTLVLAAR